MKKTFAFCKWGGQIFVCLWEMVHWRIAPNVPGLYILGGGKSKGLEMGKEIKRGKKRKKGILGKI